MKLLALLRHARAEASSATGLDFDRMLDPVGRKDAQGLAAMVSELALGYDRRVSSPAARAAETARIAGLEPELDQRIYEAGTGELLSIVQSMDDGLGSVLLVGHNPGFEHLASLLAATIVPMSTGTLVELELGIDQWSKTEAGVGRIRRLIGPR